MNLKELYSIPHIEEEIKEYEEKIRELEEIAESITAKLTGMPSSGNISDKVGEGGTAIAYYKTILESAIAQKITMEIQIVNYIEAVEDAEMRRILWLRFIKRNTWQEVADSIGGGNTEDSVRKRCNRFVEKNNKNKLSDKSENEVLY